jgi:hypothetical protein
MILCVDLAAREVGSQPGGAFLQKRNLLQRGPLAITGNQEVGLADRGCDGQSIELKMFQNRVYISNFGLK